MLVSWPNQPYAGKEGRYSAQKPRGIVGECVSMHQQSQFQCEMRPFLQRCARKADKTQGKNEFSHPDQAKEISHRKTIVV
jgi:hypothetical protein